MKVKSLFLLIMFTLVAPVYGADVMDTSLEKSIYALNNINAKYQEDIRTVDFIESEAVTVISGCVATEVRFGHQRF